MRKQANGLLLRVRLLIGLNWLKIPSESGPQELDTKSRCQSTKNDHAQDDRGSGPADASECRVASGKETGSLTILRRGDAREGNACQ